jgi:hypothetical protein
MLTAYSLNILRMTSILFQRVVCDNDVGVTGALIKKNGIR